MNAAAIMTPAPAALRAQANRTSVAGLDPRLAGAARGGNPAELAREAAKTLFAEAFVKPIFATMREGSLAGDMFAPGAAERRFQPLLDSALADRVVDSGRFDIVDEVAGRFEKNLARRNDPLAALDRESGAARAALETKGNLR
jgi:hypothetical protein